MLNIYLFQFLTMRQFLHILFKLASINNAQLKRNYVKSKENLDLFFNHKKNNSHIKYLFDCIDLFEICKLSKNNCFILFLKKININYFVLNFKYKQKYTLFKFKEKSKSFFSSLIIKEIKNILFELLSDCNNFQKNLIIVIKVYIVKTLGIQIFFQNYSYTNINKCLEYTDENIYI